MRLRQGVHAKRNLRANIKAGKGAVQICIDKRTLIDDHTVSTWRHDLPKLELESLLLNVVRERAELRREGGGKAKSDRAEPSTVTTRHQNRPTPPPPPRTRTHTISHAFFPTHNFTHTSHTADRPPAVTHHTAVVFLAIKPHTPQPPTQIACVHTDATHNEQLISQLLEESAGIETNQDRQVSARGELKKNGHKEKSPERAEPHNNVVQSILRFVSPDAVRALGTRDTAVALACRVV